MTGLFVVITTVEYLDASFFSWLQVLSLRENSGCFASYSVRCWSSCKECHLSISTVLVQAVAHLISAMVKGCPLKVSEKCIKLQMKFMLCCMFMPKKEVELGLPVYLCTINSGNICVLWTNI